MKYENIEKPTPIALFSVTRLVFNLLIFVTAQRNVPEFSGFKARLFPGQELPSIQNILPRRLSLPSGFEHDWKKIGSKKIKENPAGSLDLCISRPCKSGIVKIDV